MVGKHEFLEYAQADRILLCLRGPGGEIETIFSVWWEADSANLAKDFAKLCNQEVEVSDEDDDLTEFSVIDGERAAAWINATDFEVRWTDSCDLAYGIKVAEHNNAALAAASIPF